MGDIGAPITLGRRLYIGNLDGVVNESDIRAVFDEFGKIITLFIPERGDGRKKYALLTFNEAHEADSAMKELFRRSKIENGESVSGEDDQEVEDGKIKEFYLTINSQRVKIEWSSHIKNKEKRNPGRLSNSRRGDYNSRPRHGWDRRDNYYRDRDDYRYRDNYREGNYRDRDGYYYDRDRDRRETETEDQGGTLAIMGEGDMVVEIVILIDPPLIETKILTEIVIVDIDHMAQETEKERHPHVIITEVIMKETLTEGEREEEKEKEREWVAGTKMPIDLDGEDIAIPIEGDLQIETTNIVVIETSFDGCSNVYLKAKSVNRFFTTRKQSYIMNAHGTPMVGLLQVPMSTKMLECY